MEKIKVLIISSILLFPEFSYSQNFHAAPFVRKSLMKVSLGLAGGVHTFNPIQEVFFNGSFSYNMEDQIAVRTDLFLFLPDYNFEGALEKNSSILLGPEFHFPFGHFDLVFLFEPGVSLTYFEGGSADGKPQVEPVMSLSLAPYYYIFRNFHVFVSGGYFHGNYFSENDKPYRLDEFRLTGGLGINFFVNHQPAFQRKRTKFRM